MPTTAHFLERQRNVRSKTAASARQRKSTKCGYTYGFNALFLTPEGSETARGRNGKGNEEEGAKVNE